jgi:ABC-type polysaccharide/polyol phosphate export permease
MSPNPTPTAAVASPGVPGAAVTPIEDTLRVTVPVPRRVRLRDIWATMPVGWMLGRRDIKVKYKQSALGPLWLVLQPIAMLAAITIAFSYATNAPDTGSVPYVVFALVGLAVWTYVQMTITVAPQTLVSNQTVVRRSPCPRIAFVTGTLISVLPPLGVVLAASVIAAVISGSIGIEALAMPVLIVWLIVLMWGFTLLVTALGGRFRDAVALAPVIVQAGIFFTPVGYPLSAAGSLSKVLAFNPASGVIEAWRWSLLGMAPDGFAIVVGLAETVVAVLLGWYVFGRMETRFSDYV